MVLYGDKVMFKDLEMMMWDCFKDVVLVVMRFINFKEDMEIVVVEGIY